MKTRRPIFLVGSGRSGTTLLQSMLMRVDGLCFSSETQFCARTLRRAKIFGPLEDQVGFERTLRSVLDTAAHNELDVDSVALEAELRDAPRTYPNLFDTLLAHLQVRLPDCRRLGEKSPNHLLHVDWLLEHFPDAQVIAIVRDGRDVAISQREAFAEPLLSAAIRWRHCQRLVRRYARIHSPERYTSVSYEALVTEPERELRRLCDFLGETFTAGLLEHHKRERSGFAERETHKQRTLEPVTTSRIARYRGVLARRELALFQLVAGGELRAHGYALEPIPALLGLPGLLRDLPGVLLRRRRYFEKVRDTYR